MKNSSSQLEPNYNCELVDIEFNKKIFNDPSKFPITATVLQKKIKKITKRKSLLAILWDVMEPEVE